MGSLRFSAGGARRSWGQDQPGGGRPAARGRRSPFGAVHHTGSRRRGICCTPTVLGETGGCHGHVWDRDRRRWGAGVPYEAGALSVLLPALETQGVAPTIFVGTSAGAINAAAFAALINYGPTEASRSRARGVADDPTPPGLRAHRPGSGPGGRGHGLGPGHGLPPSVDRAARSGSVATDPRRRGALGSDPTEPASPRPARRQWPWPPPTNATTARGCSSSRTPPARCRPRIPCATSTTASPSCRPPTCSPPRRCRW